MHFVYEGFTHEGNRRSFSFRGIEERDSISVFLIEIDVDLLLQNGVLIQEGPMFCLQLLTAASLAGPDWLAKFHAYRVVGEDFRPLIVERQRQAAEKALKKAAHKPFRKPSPASNAPLGMSLARP